MTNGNGNKAQIAPDRMAPHSVESEEAVLGSIMLNPDSYHEVADFLAPDSFFIKRDGWAWEAANRIIGRGEEIDNVTVMEELRQQGRLDDFGGPAYITYLINHTPSSIYTETYGRIIERAAIRRGYLGAASAIAKVAHEESSDIDDVINQCESAVLKVSQIRHKAGVKTSGDIMQRVFKRVENAMASGISGVETGITDLDRLLGGLQDSDLIIVAGRPAMGKTSLILSIGKHVCEKGGTPLILSKEMTDEQLGQRMISMDTGITMHQMRTGKIDESEFSTFTSAVGKIGAYNFVVDDSTNMPLHSLCGMARRAKRDHDINLIMVDFLQLIQGSGDNRAQEVGSVARGLKELARELNVPVLVATQLNRKVEERQNKRPQLADMAESGQIEQAADVVIGIYRDEVYSENTERINQADLIVLKHRNGPTATIPTYFNKERTLFSNLAKTDVDFAGYGPSHADNYVNAKEE